MLQPSVQTAVQSDMQIGHLDDVAELEKNDPNSSLLALSIISTKLLKDVDQMDIPASDQDISPKEPLPTIYLDLPSTGMSPPWDFNQYLDPSTPQHPTLDQLTFELTQSTKKNEVYVKLISELRKENKELRLQIKNMEDLHKTVSLSQRDRQAKRALFKA